MESKKQKGEKDPKSSTPKAGCSSAADSQDAKEHPKVVFPTSIMIQDRNFENISISDIV